ncbi:co-chaperone YbbN [Pseudarthrobacter sp. J1738]|uniref:co-chaperone YbbN n=1 Tax=unclassified Pseudarthrobacter TaxID=2647000 RepID=UPI003D291866
MSLPPSRPSVPGASEPISLRGAVDLSPLKNPRPGAAGTGATSSAGSAPGAGQPAGQGAAVAEGQRSYRVDITEQNFQELVQISAQVPVVVAMWAQYSPESAQVLATTQAQVDSYNGALVLGAADIEAFPQLAQAFAVTAVPSVVALVKGQPVPLFQGSADADRIRTFLDELLNVARANGVTGSLNGALGDDPAAAAEVPLPPLHQEAYDAIEAGDFATAEQAYRKALAEQPADRDAKAGLAQVQLMIRLQDVTAPQAEELRAKAADAPDDLDAQLLVADLDISGGHVEDGFARIVSFIGRNFGESREPARVRLLELFDVVGPQDERVAKARQALARVLF